LVSQSPGSIIVSLFSMPDEATAFATWLPVAL
jgi:hypothetical protein